MKKEEKTTAVVGLVIVIVISLIIIAVAAAFLLNRAGVGKKPDASVYAAEYMNGLDMGSGGEQYAVTTDGTRLYIDREPVTAEGKILYEYLKDKWSFYLGETVQDKKTASAPVNINCPDTALFNEELHKKLQENLQSAVKSAESKAEIYNEDLSYRQDVIDTAFKTALIEVCEGAAEKYTVTVSSQLKLEYASKQWNVINGASAGSSLDERAEQLKDSASAGLEYIPVIMKIDENATAGPVPDPACFGTTSDPGEVSQLLETAKAQNLIGGQTLCWNSSISFIPGTQIRYYLDDSILMIEWQEKEAGMVGTFAEVFIADGSQLRRKIAGDSFGDMNFKTTSAFGAETNSVLAVGGDFYNHARNCGVVVYNRKIYRYDLTTCDNCFITADGDMLFSYRDQWHSQSEADAFVSENDIVFSLCFGPVLIDNGKDVTPQYYPHGQIDDTYARAALGMLGEHHYLTMNLNCGEGEYYNYATLRQAADAMVKRNCIKAYTLDGGQTATTAVKGELINPVQFGWEKEISDVIYFATAVTQ